MSALWVWPVTLFILVDVECLLDTISPLSDLQYSHPVVFGMLQGAVMGLIIGFCLRRSYKLV